MNYQIRGNNQQDHEEVVKNLYLEYLVWLIWVMLWFHFASLKRFKFFRADHDFSTSVWMVFRYKYFFPWNPGYEVNTIPCHLSKLWYTAAAMYCIKILSMAARSEVDVDPTKNQFDANSAFFQILPYRLFEISAKLHRFSSIRKSLLL